MGWGPQSWRSDWSCARYLRKCSRNAPSIHLLGGQGSGEMRLMMAAALGVALFSSAKAGVDVNRLAQCDDRNALDDISVDARLVAIKFYYDGFTHGLTDRTRGRLGTNPGLMTKSWRS